MNSHEMNNFVFCRYIDMSDHMVLLQTSDNLKFGIELPFDNLKNSEF